MNDIIEIKQLKFNNMTLNDIADSIVSVDAQSSFLIGQMLVEARSRFASDIEFGRWRSILKIDLSPASINRIMNQVRYFKTTESMVKLGKVVIDKISAPINKDISKQLESAANKYYDDNQKKMPVIEADKVIKKSQPKKKIKPKPEPTKDDSSTNKKIKQINQEMSLSKALTIFDCHPLSENIIKVLFKYHASKMHPDKGGSEKEFNQLCDAKEFLIRRSRRS